MNRDDILFNLEQHCNTLNDLRDVVEVDIVYDGQWIRLYARYCNKRFYVTTLTIYDETTNELNGAKRCITHAFFAVCSVVRTFLL